MKCYVIINCRGCLTNEGFINNMIWTDSDRTLFELQSLLTMSIVLGVVLLIEPKSWNLVRRYLQNNLKRSVVKTWRTPKVFDIFMSQTPTVKLGERLTAMIVSSVPLHHHQNSWKYLMQHSRNMILYQLMFIPESYKNLLYYKRQ